MSGVRKPGDYNKPGEMTTAERAIAALYDLNFSLRAQAKAGKRRLKCRRKKR